nr:DUF3427 domain-containing protein [uncultured Cetobacterium sp.]
MNKINFLNESIQTSLIDKNIESNLKYQHKLLSNKNEKIITQIKKELLNCEEFIISVAFITESGVTLILEELKQLQLKNIKGKILTGDYLNFTQPKALKKLLEFSNIELKILSNENFHAKGYFFKKNNIWNIVIGSSNLTQTALTTNFEWNLKISSLENGKITNEIITEFNNIFNFLPNLNLKIIENYEKIYNISNKFFKNQKINQKLFFENEIKPNYMQEKALENLKKLREVKNKALIISATGTGKTYLSAFDIKNVNPNRILFIAHRKTILEKAKFTFENIIKNKKMGIYEKDKLNFDYLFAMIQTLSKDEHLQNFPKDYFDYIVIDEVHHSGAKSYQKLLNYFTPKFLLGMTATPERSDSFDIYQLFDHNIAYEIRLHDALKEKLLCPFHYFGISDILINGKNIDEKTAIKDLVIDQRVEHILEKSKFYGYSGEKLHGLIFVSKVDEAKELSKKFIEKGIKCIALTGDDSDETRERAIEKLERGIIEYILTVDIFNEGVDIPCVNQVILLRPTESSIVYIQQLGRGLRKSKNKEFVVVLDFIGNYEKNFLIPTAISQNNSFDKDFMKRFVKSGTNIIPGESTITFEEVVKERIFENIGQTNFSTKKNIEHDFNLLEKQLGRTPYLYDFFNRNMIEPSIILKYKKDYDEILKVLKPKEYFGKLTSLEKNFLKFLSSFFTPSKRVHEMLILKDSLQNIEVSFNRIEKILKESFNIFNQGKNLKNAAKHLGKEIFTSLSTTKEFEQILENEEGIYKINKNFMKSYNENSYFKILIDDLIKYNLAYVEKNYKQNTTESIQLYKEYTKQEGFWYLNLDFNNGYQVSGYTFFEEERKVVVFITLDDSNMFSNFNNKFIDSVRIPWYSKGKRCLVRDGKKTKEGLIGDNYYTVEVFAKKTQSENFYYLGEVSEVLNPEEIILKEVPMVKYEFKLKYEVENELFEYLNG